ncbi:MAG TPA: hypothetical protein VGJ04_11660 [Pirellulales bacterium]|jgi:hypothetical protein
MWTIRSEKLEGNRGLRFTADSSSPPATFDEVLNHLQSEADFRTRFNTLLANTPFSAFRWETPPVTLSTVSRPFEFVLLDSPGLARTPDRQAFAEHFAGAQSSVVAFENLGRDAVLVVPCPRADDSAYGHLAAFVRQAPPAQHSELWQTVAEQMLQRISKKPVWLSTAGAGVSWLHVRLDDRPKYYGFGPYRLAT